MSNKTNNQIVYRAGISFGEPAAEDDDLLYDCFVDLPAYESVRDRNSPKSILLGRTGSGKSALLKKLELDSDDITRIDPYEFSFSYLSNSNVVNFVTDLGCDLNVLFGFLWKHVMLCKIVNLYFDTRGRWEAALQSLAGNGAEALEYVSKYGDKFWVDSDKIVEEFSHDIESKINSQIRGILGSDIAKVEAGLGADLSLSNSQKKQIVQRVKHATSELQIQKLGRAINALNSLLSNKRDYYLIIDDLDGEWTDSEIKFQMIRSLVECIKSFRKIRTVKIIVSLRSDVYERAISSYQGHGFQPEKYEGLCSTIAWNETLLKSLAQKRISEVFKRRYTKENISFGDVFPEKIRKTDAFQYLVERTQYRPRDLIAFLNQIFSTAEGRSTIVEKTVTTAEAAYSRKRFEALVREWELVHPLIRMYLRFLRDRTGNIAFSEISAKELCEGLIIEVAEEEQTHPIDSVHKSANRYLSKSSVSRLTEFARHLCVCLYKVGAIGVKPVKGEAFRTAYRDEPVMLPDQISADAAFRVCPMLWRALGITPNIG